MSDLVGTSSPRPGNDGGFDPPLAAMNDPRCCDLGMCREVPTIRLWFGPAWGKAEPASPSVYCARHAKVIVERSESIHSRWIVVRQEALDR